MPYVSPLCETPEELFQTLVEDVLHATCTPQEKLLAANRLVRFCVHPEPNLVLRDRDLSGVNPPEPEPEPPPPAPLREGLARAFGLR